MTIQSVRRALGCVILASLLCAACSAVETGSDMRDPFSARSENENGIVVSWSGHTEGYPLEFGPGQREKVELRFENDSSETWQGKYCIQLLDDVGVVATLGTRVFTLDPGAAMGTPHYLRFPRDLDLEAGAYGMALIVHRPHGPSVNTVAVRIGETDAIYRPLSSVDQAALAACPFREVETDF
jgi:hypothetical protein